MATVSVVTPQEVDAFIANQERIEEQQEEARREAAERRHEEYEAKRLRGRSHWAIARKFALGATKCKGSRVFIEGNKIYSYGHHFVLATRKEEGDWGCGVKFLVNGDRYSVSTSGHTNLVISGCKPNVQIPYSALDAAGLTDSKWSESTVPHPGLRVVAYEDDRWYAVCRTCGKDVDTNGTFHLNDESDICPSPDAAAPWRHEHVLGGVVVELGGNHYLSGIDQNEPWRLRSYFLCQLACPVASIGEAYDSLKPERVRDAEARGIEVRRQGDVFLVPVSEKDWNIKLQFGRDRLAKDHKLWNGTHRASRALIADGRVFVSGSITHERRQHRTLYCKGLWYEAIKNTALASWNAVGHID
jgi:hypothetical protein